MSNTLTDSTFPSLFDDDRLYKLFPTKTDSSCEFTAKTLLVLISRKIGDDEAEITKILF